MPQYLVAGYLPDDFDPSAQDEAMVEEIHALNREMIAAEPNLRLSRNDLRNLTSTCETHFFNFF